MAPLTSTPAFQDLDAARQQVVRERVQEALRQVENDRVAAADELRKIDEEILRREKISKLLDLAPAFRSLLRPSRYKGAYGGRGSMKSWTFGRLVLARCMTRPGTRGVCIREIQKSLEQSVKRLLEDLIEMYDLGSFFKVLSTHIETPGGGIIIFQGMQNHTADSIKSLEGYDFAWVEEAQSLSARSLELLRPTIRAPQSDGSKAEIWFTWNPNKITDPVDEFLRGATPAPDAIVIRVSFKDNPHLPQVLLDELTWDRNRDLDKYEHIWLGGYQKHSESRVFRNWRIETFETPPDVDFLFGGDWGFSVDPSVLLRGFIIGRTLYIDYEAYQVGCEIDNTPALFDKVGCTVCTPTRSCDGHAKGHGAARNWVIVSDSSRPETISYMQRHGYPRVQGARKGAGSVEEGVEFLKSYDIVLHSRCTHAIDEFTMYSFKTHPLTNEILPVLQDKKNHVIDSARYMVEAVGKLVDTDTCIEMQNAATPQVYAEPIHPVVLSSHIPQGSFAPILDVQNMMSLFGR